MWKAARDRLTALPFHDIDVARLRRLWHAPRMPRTSRLLILVLSLVVCTAPRSERMHAQASSSAPAAIAVMAEPGVSPDGREIAFSSGGDIWTVPRAGGEARLLVSHAAHESRPLYSPDGRRLAFVSTRTGNGDIYMLTFATGTLTRVTWDDAPELLDGWSRDATSVYVSSGAQEVSGTNDVWCVPVDGGAPIPVAAERYANEYFAAESPDGSRVAYSARGIAAAQWWRNGHSHIDESEIWVRGADATKPGTEMVVARGAKALWPMWARDGQTLFFMSDRGGAENIWRRDARGDAKAVTTFTSGRVLWPSIAADGSVIVFEREFGVWTLDPASGAAARVEITRRGAPAGREPERQRLTREFSSLALSPDGKKVAFVARGEIYAAAAKDGGDAARATTSGSVEQQVVWLPDSRRVVFSSLESGRRRIGIFDFGDNTTTWLTNGHNDYAAQPSPDGKAIAFVRDGKELHVVSLDTRADRVVATGSLAGSLTEGRPIAWSPDGKWIATLARGTKGFTNIGVVAAEGGDLRMVSALPNMFSDSLAWSNDGRSIFFVTAQRTEDGRVAQIDLTPRVPPFREDAFRKLFEREQQPGTPTPASPAPARPAAPPSTKDVAATAPPKPEAASADKKPAPKPTEIVFEGILRRVNLLPIGLDVADVIVAPDGKSLVVAGEAEGQTNLYTYSIDDEAREPATARQITSTSTGKSDLAISSDGKEVYFLEDGRIGVATIEKREARPLAVTAEFNADFSTDRLSLFDEAWSMLGEHFYDPAMHGADWNAQRTRFAPAVAGAATHDEFRRVMSMMIGELNASHLGISAPPGGGGGQVTGRLGLTFEALPLSDGALRVAAVIPLGPAALTRAIAVGDVLVGINGQMLTPTSVQARLLDGTIGKRVTLSVRSAAAGSPTREVVVKPVDLPTERGLRYRAWVEERRAYVERISKGRLGYVHMPDMGAGSLAQLYLDLDAAQHGREGIVVDLRNNNGGFVNAYAIDVFARRPYLSMTERGRETLPARSVLGQRAIERPSVLVINQHSLSDAEDFTEGYRALKLGPVVGEPTAGWIIYTWNTRLWDGTTLRLPRMRIDGADGRNMERSPRPVDVAVSRRLDEDARGVDSQLDAAVKALLERVPSSQ